MYEFDTIESAIEDIKRGKIIIVVDDEDRENEGDFIMAADRVTPDAINFMAKHGRGLICTPITKERAQVLELPLMVTNNECLHETAFTVSVDSVHAGTGISCEDRSRTIMDLVQPVTIPSDLKRPGHIFPLIAKDGGVLERNGHTEAAVDLARIAGCYPAGVICEIMNEDGSMARVGDLFKLSKKFNLKFITIADLIKYRKKIKKDTPKAMVEVQEQLNI
ncbi:MAG: 3,4-dihydroxy-2-butanone-4-phosphate synthase [Bdellovibrionota bacterium]|nr:3,4-dihydroxy-2-butanone-4-phosphate synthase [Bdellovibrionota bacterium]